VYFICTVYLCDSWPRWKIDRVLLYAEISIFSLETLWSYFDVYMVYHFKMLHFVKFFFLLKVILFCIVFESLLDICGVLKFLTLFPVCRVQIFGLNRIRNRPFGTGW
jgi:hypothetical protein